MVACLPHLSASSETPVDAAGGKALNRLDERCKRHVLPHGKQPVKVIRHHHERKRFRVSGKIVITHGMNDLPPQADIGEQRPPHLGNRRHQINAPRLRVPPLAQIPAMRLPPHKIPPVGATSRSRPPPSATTLPRLALLFATGRSLLRDGSISIIFIPENPAGHGLHLNNTRRLSP